MVVLDSVHIPSPLVTTVAGALVSALAFLFICANVMVVKIMLSDREIYKHNAYKIMIAIGVADIGFSTTHLISGPFIVARYHTHEIPVFWVGKLLDALPGPTYQSYVLLTTLLAVDRFCLTYSPTMERRLFSMRGMFVWLCGVEIVAFCFFFALLSPYARMPMYWEQLNTAYDSSLPLTDYVFTAAAVIQIVTTVLSTLLYASVFAMLLRKKKERKGPTRKSSRNEWKILCQCIPFTAYIIVSRGIWYTSQMAMFENTVAWKLVNIFLRIGTGAVNPAIYYFSNITLRRKIRSNITVTSRERTINNNNNNYKTTNEESITK